MTTINKALIPAKFAEDAQATQYTADRCTAVIDKFTATNVGGANALLSVHLVTAGGTAAADNCIVKERQIAPGETYTLPPLPGHILDMGDFISTLADTASAIVIRASGREITG